VSETLFEDLRAFAEAEASRRRIPGVALGVLHEGTEYTAGFGVTNAEHPLAVDADTLFQIGSITKTFTAMAAVRLVEAASLALDRPVRSYLPELRLPHAQSTETLTCRHLLTHTGGFTGDHFSDTGRGDDALAKYVAELADLEQLTPPGETYSYCNSGFSLLGRVIEVLTGETFEAALARLVLAPLGLTSSFFFPEEAMLRRFVVGHRVQPDGTASVLSPWPIPRGSNPAGGLVSSVKDQLRYARFQLGDGRVDGEPVVSAGGMAALRTPLVPSTGGPSRMVALGWNVGPHTVQHGGSTNGQAGILFLAPEHGFALSVLTNAIQGGELAGAVAQRASTKWLGIPRTETPPMVVDREVLDECVGLYEHPIADVEIGRLGDALVERVIPKGGFPTKDSPPPAFVPPLKRRGFYAEDRVVGLDPPHKDERAELVRDREGRIAFYRMGGRLRRKVR
jgi:CubicO group peptidase (beta-lactamase class C family)